MADDPGPIRVEVVRKSRDVTFSHPPAKGPTTLVVPNIWAGTEWESQGKSATLRESEYKAAMRALAAAFERGTPDIVLGSVFVNRRRYPIHFLGPEAAFLALCSVEEVQDAFMDGLIAEYELDGALESVLHGRVAEYPYTGADFPTID